MYLARFDADSLCWFQALLRIERIPRSDESGRRIWAQTFERLIRAVIADPDLAASLRVIVDRGRLRWTLLCTGACEREIALRRLVGAFTRLNTITGDCVATPDDRATHDGLAEDFPPLRCRITMPSYRQGTAWFACDFSMAPLLDDVLARAQALGHAIGYHVNVQPLSPDPECQRSASKNVLAVESLAGVSAAAVTLQRRLAANLIGAAAVREEIVGAYDAESAAWLQRELHLAFVQRYGSLKFEPPDFTFSEEPLEAALVATRHAAVFAPLSVDEACATALGADGAVALLSWTPRDELALGLPSRESPAVADGAGEGTETAAVDLQQVGAGLVPYDGPEDFLFVSYKHEDMPRIATTLQELVRGGHRIWYDRGIPGGAEWDALIEEKIERCRLVLLFVSRKSIASRYVRREVKFADALNKSLVSVQLEPVDLGHGMKMLLNQYQVINAPPSTITTEIERAVKYARSPSA